MGRARAMHGPKWHKTPLSTTSAGGTPPALPNPGGPHRNQNLQGHSRRVISTLAGFTASGIIANLYRLLADKPKSTSGRVGYIAVMIVASPKYFISKRHVLAPKALRGFRLSLAAAISAYWSFGLGLFIIQIGMALVAHRTVNIPATSGWRTMSASPSRTTAISGTRSSRSAMVAQARHALEQVGLIRISGQHHGRARDQGASSSIFSCV